LFHSSVEPGHSLNVKYIGYSLVSFGDSFDVF